MTMKSKIITKVLISQETIKDLKIIIKLIRITSMDRTEIIRVIIKNHLIKMIVLTTTKAIIKIEIIKMIIRTIKKENKITIIIREVNNITTTKIALKKTISIKMNTKLKNRQKKNLIKIRNRKRRVKPNIKMNIKKKMTIKNSRKKIKIRKIERKWTKNQLTLKLIMTTK